MDRTSICDLAKSFSGTYSKCSASYDNQTKELTVLIKKLDKHGSIDKEITFKMTDEEIKSSDPVIFINMMRKLFKSLDLNHI